jgi:hypothetical protein
MVYKCTLHMLYSNKKTTDIAISHVILQQFCMQLFSFMPALKHQQNLTAEQISTSVDRENNTIACRLLGAGVEHRKVPQKPIIIQKKKNSNHRRWTPNLQGRIKQKKTTISTKPVRKHEQDKLHPLGPQSINPSQTNRTNNPQTNEPTRTTEPINNICISNDYETIAEARKEPKTYDDHATTNNKTFLLANCKH